MHTELSYSSTAPSIEIGHPSGICDSSSVSPWFSIIVPSMGISTVALKLRIARLLFQVSTARNPFPELGSGAFVPVASHLL